MRPASRPLAALAAILACCAVAQAQTPPVPAAGDAATLLETGEYERALEEYARMLAVAPDENARSAALAGRVRALVLLDRPREALASVPPGATRTPELARALSMAATAAGRPPRAETADARFEFASESDGFRGAGLELTATHFLSETAQLEARISHMQYAQDDWRRRGEGVAAGWTFRLSDALSTSSRVATTHFGGWSPVVGASNLVYAPDDRWRAEAFAESSVVETREALDARLTHTIYGLAVDYVVSPRLTLVGVAYGQRFSDGNRRDGLRGRAAVSVSRPLGLGVELRAREFHSTQPDAVGYFNPQRFREVQLIGTWGRRFESGWRVRAAAGPGTQKTEPDGAGRGTGFGELRAERLLGSCFKLQLSLARSTSAGVSDSGYGRTYGSAQVTCAW